MECLADDCTRDADARGLCRAHYARWWRHGSIESRRGAHRRIAPIHVRPITTVESPCREWWGPHDKDGYGTIDRTTPGKRSGSTRVHRWIWAQANGPIPAHTVIMHRCDNPACFRLDHLVAGSISDNSLDMIAKGREGGRFKIGHPSYTSSDVTCRSGGHLRTPENTYVRPNGDRTCRDCRKESR